MLGRELAEQASIPANYLSKVLWTLGNAGIIDATRGNCGGHRLKRNASEIYLFEVIELFDPDRRGSLVSYGWDCNQEHPCTAHEA